VRRAKAGIQTAPHRCLRSPGVSGQGSDRVFAGKAGEIKESQRYSLELGNTRDAA
jgi:hypothetical protein